VIGIDDDWCRGIERARLRSGLAHDQISTAGPVDFGVGAGMGRLSHVRSLRTHGSTGSTPIADLAGIGTLRGHHNSQNAAAAAAVALHLGIGPDVIAAALRTYPGLPHRMEEVGRHGRVIFINDSKATNADSAEKALLCFDRDIFWILGGRAKEGGIASLAPYFPRIARAYLIGEASDAFAATLAGHVANELCRTLDVAVRRAAADAAACGGLEPIVLLSPACASYDQYRGFDQRGDAFRSLVHAIVHGDAP
jgi:UDP-N-acetylmuramoylalanine--D-glutamate ligase